MFSFDLLHSSHRPRNTRNCTRPTPRMGGVHFRSALVRPVERALRQLRVSAAHVPWGRATATVSGRLWRPAAVCSPTNTRPFSRYPAQRKRRPTDGHAGARKRQLCGLRSRIGLGRLRLSSTRAVQTHARLGEGVMGRLHCPTYCILLLKGCKDEFHTLLVRRT